MWLCLKTAAPIYFLHVCILSVVRGFHVYKAVWTPVVNFEHSTQQEHSNSEDNYAVAIMNGEAVGLGHVCTQRGSVVGGPKSF